MSTGFCGPPLSPLFFLPLSLDEASVGIFPSRRARVPRSPKLEAPPTDRRFQVQDGVESRTWHRPPTGEARACPPARGASCRPRRGPVARAHSPPRTTTALGSDGPTKTTRCRSSPPPRMGPPHRRGSGCPCPQSRATGMPTAPHRWARVRGGSGALRWTPR